MNRAADTRIVAGSTMLATLMYTIDTTITNVALPHIQSSLQATQDQGLWILTAYIVSGAIMTPLTGFLAVRFGVRPVMLVSVAGFTAVSMLCGLATSLPQLVFFRVLQGAFGAALLPISQSTMLTAFPRERHAFALAIWGMGAMVGPVLGPTLGGWLTEAHNWRWVFFINLPIGVIAWLGLATSAPRGAFAPDRRFDIKGFVLLALGIAFAQLCFDRGQGEGWFDSTEVLIEAALGATFIYMFVVHTLTTRHPFFNPALFKDRNLIAGAVTLFTASLFYIAPLALLPAFMQQLQGHTTMAAGVLMAPRGVGMMVSMLASARIAYKVDFRIVSLSGTAILVAACWPLVHLTLDTSAPLLATAAFFQGIGLGFLFHSLNVGTFLQLAPELRTEGSVLVTLARMMGSSIGISILGTVLSRSSTVSHARLTEQLTPFDLERWGAATSALGHDATVWIEGEITRQALVIGYDNAFLVMAGLAALLLPTFFFFQVRGRKPSHEADAEVEAGAHSV